MSSEVPVVLELAPLPREQIGPFLLLGVDKDADKETVEAHWAQRVIWARKNQIGVALQEIHWARDVLNTTEKRVRADVSSLNPDTIDGVLRKLAQQYGAADNAGPGWQPLDAEKPLADYTPPTEVPDPVQVREGVAVPPVPREVPAAVALLQEFVGKRLDPWNLELPPGEDKDLPT